MWREMTGPIVKFLFDSSLGSTQIEAYAAG